MDEKELLQIIDEAAREGATELNLSRSQVTALPPEIGKLTNLEILNLLSLAYVSKLHNLRRG